MNYKKIWKDHYGEIPLDENGRRYEIHHIDGMHSNNVIENLKCVTIEEHYDIHYQQEDWYACFKMAQRMQKSPEEISELASKTSKRRVELGIHHWLGPTNNYTRMENGNHNWLNLTAEELSAQNSKIAKDRVAKGTNPFQGRKIVDSQLARGTHTSQIKHKCPHCSKEGKGNIFKRWHFDKCKKR